VPLDADTEHASYDPVQASDYFAAATRAAMRRAYRWPTSVTRTTAVPAASEAARSTSALMPQS